MPTPFKRDRIFYYRVSVPTDVAILARGLQIIVDVAGRKVNCKIGTNLQVSLRTRDADEAKARHHAVAAQAAEYYQMLRDGPIQKLTHKQALTLAGDIRRTWVGVFDEDPGNSARWLNVQAQNALALSGGSGPYHSLMVPTDDGRDAGIEARWGPIVDSYLTYKKLWLPDELRKKLLNTVVDAMQEADAVNLRKAQGDYSVDDDALKYPTFAAVPKNNDVVEHMGETFSGVIDRKVEELASGKEAKPMPANSEAKYRLAAREFAKFRKSEEISTVSSAEGRDWRISMLGADTLGSKTIRDRITNMKTILNWSMQDVDAPAHSNGNPFNRVTVPKVRKIPGDMKTYTAAEAALILSNARSQDHHAVRWVPWLCAYTGARVNEITQLKPQDVFAINDDWFLKITTAGGKSLKNEMSERRVPLHQDVITEGFLDWLETLHDKDFRMFSVKTERRVSDFIRKDLQISRDAIKPSHSWRHLFEDRCTACGICSLVSPQTLLKRVVRQASVHPTLRFTPVHHMGGRGGVFNMVGGVIYLYSHSKVGGYWCTQGLTAINGHAFKRTLP